MQARLWFCLQCKASRWVQKEGFYHFYHRLVLFSFNTVLYNFFLAQWKSHSSPALRKILLSETSPYCIICLAQSFPPGYCCDECNFQVKNSGIFITCIITIFQVCSAECLTHYLKYHSEWCKLDSPSVKFYSKKMWKSINKLLLHHVFHLFDSSGIILVLTHKIYVVIHEHNQN